MVSLGVFIPLMMAIIVALIFRRYKVSKARNIQDPSAFLAFNYHNPAFNSESYSVAYASSVISTVDPPINNPSTQYYDTQAWSPNPPISATANVYDKLAVSRAEPNTYSVLNTPSGESKSPSGSTVSYDMLRQQHPSSPGPAYAVIPNPAFKSNAYSVMGVTSSVQYSIPDCDEKKASYLVYQQTTRPFNEKNSEDILRILQTDTIYSVPFFNGSSSQDMSEPNQIYSQVLLVDYAEVITPLPPSQARRCSVDHQKNRRSFLF